MPPHVDILVPVLARPHRVAPLLADIAAATASGTYSVLFIVDSDDEEQTAAVLDACGDVLLTPPGTNYATKINLGFNVCRAPFLFQAADDLHYHDDWLPRALRYMTDGIGVVGTNDLCNHFVMTGKHSTHSLIRREYVEQLSGVVDEPRKVMHEGYPHEGCDDELVRTAMFRGAYAHAFDSLVEHLHPLNGRAPDDSTYARGRSRTRESKLLLKRRTPLWTP